MTEPSDSKHFTRMTSFLQQAEMYIYHATAFTLVFAALGFLIFALYETLSHAAQGDYLKALLNLLDRALVVLMLAEIIYTVGRIAKKMRLEVEPFLIIGIIAAVRRILVITAESVKHVDLTDPVFQAALAELGLLSVSILLFALAMRLLRFDGNNEH